MAKFSVGDRVRVKADSGYFRAGKAGTVVDGGGVAFTAVRLDIGMSEWIPDSALETIASTVPDGWTLASEPPDSNELYSGNVRVLLKDGREWYGFTWCKRWIVFGVDADVKKITTDMKYCGGALWDLSTDEVIAWREIEPERKADPRVRYCVAADLPTTSITVWHDTFEAADAEARRLCVKCGKPFRVLKVVEEVKPGEPVITKLEE